ncbi:MAG: hypothetical protein AAB380_01890 [Verrucomicrobiota bacterium]
MPEPPFINRDEEHLRLLTIFHFVCAALAALFACIPIIHFVLGLVMLFAPHAFGPGKNQPPQFLGLLFVILGLGLMLAGWTFAALLAWAGRCLGRRKHYTYCFVMACVACLFQPFGVVLGVFTIVVLLRPSVKQLFGQAGQPA